MKRLPAAILWFVAGYAYALLSALLAGKRFWALFERIPEHPPGTCAEDCPWPTGHTSWADVKARRRELDGTDRHDVLPTDDEVPAPDSWAEVAHILNHTPPNLMTDYLRAYEKPFRDKAAKHQEWWAGVYEELLRRAVVDWPEPTPPKTKTMDVAGRYGIHADGCGCDSTGQPEAG